MDFTRIVLPVTNFTLAISVLVASPTLSQTVGPTPDLNAESSTIRQTLKEDGVQGVILDNLQDLSNTFPSGFPQSIGNSYSSRSTSAIVAAYESGGSLFVITYYSPRMGYDDYHLAQLSKAGLRLVPLSKERLISLYVQEKTPQFSAIQGKTADGLDHEWLIKSGSVYPVALRQDGGTMDEGIYSNDSLCTGPASGKITQPLVLRSAAGVKQISQRMIAASSHGVSLQESVKVYCRSFSSTTIVWLTNDTYGVTLSLIGSELRPFFNLAPSFATKHYLIFQKHTVNPQMRDNEDDLYEYVVLISS
jgi:hypothetical protein